MAVSIDIRDTRSPEEAVPEVVAWLHHVDAVFSTYKHESPVSAIGRGELGAEDASDEVRHVLELCEEMKAATGGVFDVFEVPAPNGTSFDPSGLVKGWSIERAATILESHGCRNFCVNAGGDIALRGHPHGDDPWRVGIRHPDDGALLALVIEAADTCAIATSAEYERGAHIVDPRTGRPATGLTSATVVGPDLTVADSFATAVFIMGLDGLDWIERQPRYDAYLITDAGQTFWSSGFPRYRSAGADPR